MSSNCEVREMRNAVTVLNIIRDHSRNRSLESYVIRKAVTRSSVGGRWKSAQSGNSLAAHPTVCSVRWGAHGKGPNGTSPGAYPTNRTPRMGAPHQGAFLVYIEGDASRINKRAVDGFTKLSTAP
jgi:hypothetical protein